MRLLLNKSTGCAIFIALLLIASLVGCRIAGIIPPYPAGEKDVDGSRSTSSDGRYKYLEQSNTENHESGIIESIIEYGKDSVIGAHYPVFGKKKVDGSTKEFVSGVISAFLEEVEDYETNYPDLKAELNIDYETWLVKDRLVSIKFIILRNMPYYAHPDIEIRTAVYDLETERPVFLKDILPHGNLKNIAELVREELRLSPNYSDYLDSDLFMSGTEPVGENYSNFVLTKEHIMFLFQKYQVFPGAAGTPSVRIPYGHLEGIIHTEFYGTSLHPDMPGESGSHGDSDSRRDPDFLQGPDSPRDNDGAGGPLVEIKRPVREIDPDKPMVALTFDDGPFAKSTGSILHTLAANDAVATFFVLGNRVSSNETLLARMMNEGSEIGNHSFNHKQLTTLSPDELQQQIQKTQAAIKKATGYEPVIIRPTYGSYNEELRESAGMPMILWSVDTRDWETRDAAYVSKKVLECVQDGDIVLMHDIYVSTADAVKIIVPELKSRGYQLVTVSELHEAKGVALEAGKVYRREAKK
ncbi:MAG: polysaccharide deacetylase family protein [Bacillota bacterium]|jgi:peptidoglycan/xylan/chitin deacetylase (PgdA/CDA1 family)